MKRVVGRHGELTHYFGSEDGKNYRGFYQDMDPVLRHVKFLHDKVNSAPTKGNRNRWGYKGSIPMSVIIRWCDVNRYTYDQFARNEDRCKEKFLKWFKSEFSKFLPTEGAKARPQITVPITYKKRAS